MRERENPSKVSANPGYAAGQLGKALQTSETHEDHDTRLRALTKAKKWSEVLEGMISGTLQVGSRRPLASVPEWVAPEVVTGGFATGGLMAGGPLLPHERHLADRLGLAASDSDRTSLNAYHLSEPGLAELLVLLDTGCFDIQVPEEAGLLVFVWLLLHGHEDAAEALLREISPLFHRLRFYPARTDRPPNFGPRVFLESVSSVARKLRQKEPNKKILAERESIGVWTPLFEQMVDLFAETVDSDLPHIVPDSEGRWVDPLTNQFRISGAYPCATYPTDWRDRGLALVEEIKIALQKHRRCLRPRRPNEAFGRLLTLLKAAIADPASLTGRDVGRIRLIIARHLTKRGATGEVKRAEAKRRDALQVAKPLHHDIALVVVARLGSEPQDAGLDDPKRVTGPVSAEESKAGNLAQGVHIPDSIGRKVQRTLCDSVEALIDLGLITSGDTLAKLTPQFTSALRARSFDDPALVVLYGMIDRAFRRRRSLLLLNLEKQVQIQELPWVSALEPYRVKSNSAAAAAKEALQELATTTLRAFPHAIIPNKLLQEFGSLAKTANLEFPLVEELAADIFMGEFSPKFAEAAKRSSAFLEGSLYSRYYMIDASEIAAVKSPAPTTKLRWFRKAAQVTPPNPAFAELCSKRAGVDASGQWDVAVNGMIIEQAQILTTQNLAVLFETFQLDKTLSPDLFDMAWRCFAWVCRRQQMKSDRWHAKLIMLKNTAYAWRQMVFYLSLLPPEDVATFFANANGHLAEQPTPFSSRFRPALQGLENLSHRAPLTSAQGSGRVFLGWVKGTHWLLSDDKGGGGGIS